MFFSQEAPGENPTQDDSQVEGKGQGHDVQMERSVGLVSGVGLIVGTIIGELTRRSCMLLLSLIALLLYIISLRTLFLDSDNIVIIL